MEEIVHATRPRLLAVARRIGAPQDAEDSVQAAYHALLARPEAPSVALLPWLLAAVVRIAYRRKALARRERRIAERLARPASPLEEASRAEVAACAEALRRGGDWEPFEVYALAGLAGMGHEAEAAILAYVDGPSRRYLAEGVRALGAIDPVGASVRAEAILDDPARKLGEAERQILRKLSGR